MNAFLDTSSVLKLYHHESGTETLNAALSQGVEEIYLSELAISSMPDGVCNPVRDVSDL
jgi:hypothetical protein